MGFRILTQMTKRKLGTDDANPAPHKREKKVLSNTNKHRLYWSVGMTIQMALITSGKDVNRQFPNEILNLILEYLPDYVYIVGLIPASNRGSGVVFQQCETEESARTALVQIIAPFSNQILPLDLHRYATAGDHEIDPWLVGSVWDEEFGSPEENCEEENLDPTMVFLPLLFSRNYRYKVKRFRFPFLENSAVTKLSDNPSNGNDDTFVILRCEHHDANLNTIRCHLESEKC